MQFDSYASGIVPPVNLVSGATSQVPLTVTGILGQIANLYEVKNSVGTTLFSISPNGDVTYVGDEIISDSLTVTGNIVGNSALTVSGLTTLGTVIMNEITVSGSANLNGPTVIATLGVGSLQVNAISQFSNQIKMGDGSVGAPSIAWINDIDTGFYRIGDNDIGVSLGGVLAWSFSALGTFLPDDKYLLMGNVAATPDAALGWNTAQTVDALYCGLSAAQNTFIIAEYADRAYDFAHGAQTNPTLYIQSATQSATQWMSFAHNQTNAVIATGLGGVLISPAVGTSGSPYALTVTGAAHTTLTLSTEDIGVNFNLSATKQWATGALTTQREVLIQAPTYAFVGASTITNAYTQYISSGPIAGTFATITNSYALGMAGNLILNPITTALVGAKTPTGPCLKIENSVWDDNDAIARTHTWEFISEGVSGDTPYGIIKLYYTDPLMARSALFNVNRFGNGSVSAIWTCETLSVQGGAVTSGTATIDGGNIIIVKGAQTSDPTVTMALSANANGDFSITTTIGDITLTSQDDIALNAIGGSVTMTPTAATSGTASTFTITPAANTGLTTTVDAPQVVVSASTQTHATGAMTSASYVNIGAPTYAFAGASTVTDAYNVYIAAPVQGALATLTSIWSLGLAGRLQCSAGTAALPSIASSADVDTGLYFSASAINLSTDGTIRGQMAADGFRANMVYPVSATTSMSIKGVVADAANIAVKIGNSVALTTAGGKIASFYSDAFSTERAYVDYLGSFNSGPGTTLLPAYSFTADPNTGMWNSGADTIAFTTGGTTRLSLSTTVATFVSMSASGITTLGMGGDLTNYDAVNDGNPSIFLGSAAAERLGITATYATGTQTLQTVNFVTATASATADYGAYSFNVDGSVIATIDDGGIEVTGTVNATGGFTDGTMTIDGSGAITGVTTLGMAGLLTNTVGAAEAVRLATNVDDYTKFTLDANGGLTIQSVDGAAAAANIAITADGTFAITSTGFNLTGAGAVSGVTTLSMNNQLTNTLTDGTTPMVITSTTKVANLNVDRVDDYHASAAISASGALSITANVYALHATGATAVSISHSTADGYIHLPSGGSTNQILKNSGTAGTGSWGTVTENAGVLANISSDITGTQNTALTLAVPNQGVTTNAGVGLIVQADAGGSGTSGGAGGSITLRAGDANGTGDNAGGSVNVDLGSFTGSGLPGMLEIKYNNTSVGSIAAGGETQNFLAFVGKMADGASAIAVGITSNTTYTTTNAKLLSIQNNLVEKAYIDKDGGIKSTPRITTVASSATPTPVCDTTDVFTVTALAEGATFGAPTGTPLNGQKMTIRILDNGTARLLSWNAIYRAGTDITLPTTTVLSKTMYLGFMYNTASSTWDLLAKCDNL